MMQMCSSSGVGHVAHDEVQDEIVDRVKKRVLEGMGLISLAFSSFF